jgi:hypothetical protein
MQYFLRRKTGLEENSEKSDGTHKNTEGFLLTVQPCRNGNRHKSRNFVPIWFQSQYGGLPIYVLKPNS